MELRINTKGVGGKLPNFGFVVFDDSEPVQRILGAKVEGACINISLPTLFHLVVDFGDTHCYISFDARVHLRAQIEYILIETYIIVFCDIFVCIPCPVSHILRLRF